MPTQAQLFTTSGTFTVPAGVTSVFVTMVGGGGGGGPGHVSVFGGGGGGGAGEFCMRHEVKVTSGASITVTIGGGGGGGAVNDLHGGNGGPTSFGSVSCQGGYGGGNFTAAGLSYSLGGRGGGANGGSLWNGTSTYQNLAQPGSSESHTFHGGPSGGSCNNSPGRGVGASCQANAGGQSHSDHSGLAWNGGGGASPFGPGGDGGIEPPANGQAQNGSDGAGAGSGGGGAGGRWSGTPGDPPAIGGSGAAGACLVEWIA